jgi:hypothetical protein
MDDNRSVTNLAAGLGGSWALPPAGSARNDLEDHGGNGGTYQDAETGDFGERLTKPCCCIEMCGILPGWR